MRSVALRLRSPLTRQSGSMRVPGLNCFTFLLPVLCISFTSTALATDRQEALRKTVPATPLNMTVKCSQANDRDVIVTFENTSDRAISFGSERTIEGDFRLELYDPTGTLVTTAKYKGKALQPGTAIVTSGEIWSLQPEEKQSVTLHLPDLFVLSKRGNYSFKVTRKLKANSPPDDEVSCPAITLSLDPSKW